MKREFLKKLGLTDEQIDSIMEENGNDVNTLKSDNAILKKDLEDAKKHLETANETIKSYKNMNIDEIKKSADDYKQKFEDAQKESAKEIDKLKLQYAINTALTKAKAKNINAVKATIDLSNVKLDGDKLLGFDDLLKKSKEQDPYLYEAEETKPAGTGSTGNFAKKNGSQKMTKEEFNKLSYFERVELKKKDEALYNELRGE